MKRIFWVLVVLSVWGGCLFAGERVIEIRTSLSDLLIHKRWGFDLVNIEGADLTTLSGAPALPVKQIQAALPRGAQEISLTLVHRESVLLDGIYDLLPVPEPVTLQETVRGFPFRKDPAVYGGSDRYPMKHAEIRGSWDVRGRDFVTLVIHPLQYDPREGKLELSTNLVIRLEWTESEALHRPQARSSADGPEYVVISPDHWEQGWDELIQWKTKKGIPAQVVTLSYIYTHYPGASDPERIRAFIQDAHFSWGTQWFLLGGDSSLLPCGTAQLLGDDIPNDTYYGDFDDDYKVEVFVGRATADHSVEKDRFIQKTLSYEKAPPDGFAEEAFFFAFDLDPYTRTEELMEDIEALYLPPEMTLHSEYDSEPGGHKADALDYLEKGPNLVNHGDHSDYNRLGAGHYVHKEDLSIQDIVGLSNQDRFSVVKSVGCYSCAFDYNDCIAEHMCKLPDGGAVAFIGNTRFGWYTLGSTENYSFKYDRLFFKALMKDGHHRAGEALAMSKNGFYPTDDHYRYVFKELNLLGDPELPLWTGAPGTLDVTHASKIVKGSQSFTVQVSAGGTPMEGALCCLWKGEEVYARSETDGVGEAHFLINPASSGILWITVTAARFLPYEGEAKVLEAWPAPEIDTVIPRCGNESGGTCLTIFGANFTPGSMIVKIDGNPCSAVVVVSPTELTCTAPSGTNGYKEVRVENSHGTDFEYPGFRYFPTGQDPFNGTDIPSSSLVPASDVTLIASGMPGRPFIVFFSWGGGPLPTPWGWMGLEVPVSTILFSKLNLEGFFLLSFQVPPMGSAEFYLHILGENPAGAPQWSWGGEAPSGSGSIFFKW